MTVIEYNATINVEEAAMNDSRGSYFRGQAEDFAYQIGIIRAYCDNMLRNETLFRQIRDLKPDLVVIDNLPQVGWHLNVNFLFIHRSIGGGRFCRPGVLGVR
jgi:hypothetical protein